MTRLRSMCSKISWHDWGWHSSYYRYAEWPFSQCLKNCGNSNWQHVWAPYVIMLWTICCKTDIFTSYIPICCQWSCSSNYRSAWRQWFRCLMLWQHTVFWQTGWVAMCRCRRLCSVTCRNFGFTERFVNWQGQGILYVWLARDAPCANQLSEISAHAHAEGLLCITMNIVTYFS